MSTGTVAPTRHPVLVDEGPAVFSTRMELVPWPVVDANGYYRELGVGPAATRADLMAAYLRLGGADSPRLTYVLAQLLDRQTRTAYDRLPAGGTLADRDVSEALLLAVLRSAPDLFLPNAGSDVAQGSLEVQDEPLTTRQRSCSAPEPTRCNGYGYYLWRCNEAPQQTLGSWQTLITGVLNSQGIVTMVAVGVVGGAGESVAFDRVGGVPVFYLNEQAAPTRELALAAVQLAGQDPNLRDLRDLRSNHSEESHMTEATVVEPIELDWSGSEGAEGLEARAAEEAKNRGGRIDYLNHFRLAPPADKGAGVGETKAVRFLTDPFSNPKHPNVQRTVTCLVHPRIACRPPGKVRNKEGEWVGEKLPKQMTAACLEDRIFAPKDANGRPIKGHCPTHGLLDVDGKPVRTSLRTFGLVIPQKEVTGSDGAHLGWEDETKTVTRIVEGKETSPEVPDYQLAEFGRENFWDNLIQVASAAFHRDPTVLHRVWFVTRRGTTMDNTKFIFRPDDPEMVPGPTGDIPLDLRDPVILDALYPDAPNLRAQITRIGSKEYLEHLFFATNGTAPVTPVAEAPSAALEALRAQIEPNVPVSPTAALPAQVVPTPAVVVPAPTAPPVAAVAAPVLPVPAATGDPVADRRARLLAKLAPVTQPATQG